MTPFDVYVRATAARLRATGEPWQLSVAAGLLWAAIALIVFVILQVAL